MLLQLEHRGVIHQADLAFQKAAIEELLPFSYGGGTGISRLLMLLLKTGYIREVQCGLTHDTHCEQAMTAGIDLIPDHIVDVSPRATTCIDENR
jgi:aspartate--ammonia ligase